MTSQLMVESRNDLGTRLYYKVSTRGGGGDTGGTSEGFYGKIAIKLVAKNSIFLFMCLGRS